MDIFALICVGLVVSAITIMVVSAAVFLAVVCGAAVKDIIKKGL